MAKKKKQEAPAEVIAEEIKEEVIEEVTEEAVSEEVAEAVVEEVIEEAKSDASDQFVYAQLKAINKLNNPAKAKRLADRVLRNRKR